MTVRPWLACTLLTFAGLALSPALPADDKDGKEGKGDKAGAVAPSPADAPGTEKGKRKAGKPVDPKRVEEIRRQSLFRQHPEADLNKDGKISAEEETDFETKRLDRFLKVHPDLKAKADADKDGKVSLDEVLKFRRANAVFAEAIRIEDYLQKHPEAKEKMDADKDGAISHDEWLAYLKSLRNAPAKSGRPAPEAEAGKSEKH